jgi:hypothetical protein
MTKSANGPDALWVSLPMSHLVRSNYKIAINIRELTSLTNSFSLKYTSGCTPSLVKSYPKELSMQYRVVCTKADSDPAGHEVRIKLDVAAITKDTKLTDLNVRVSCTCPAFLYWGAQWNINQKDGLEGDPRPLLQAPTEKLDKRNGYLICKHVKVVADRIIPSVSRVINGVTRRLRHEEFKQQQEQEIREREEQLRLEEEKRQQGQPAKKKSPLPYKPKPAPPAKPNRNMLDMGVKPTTTKNKKTPPRSGIIQ